MNFWKLSTFPIVFVLVRKVFHALRQNLDLEILWINFIYGFLSLGREYWNLMQMFS